MFQSIFRSLALLLAVLSILSGCAATHQQTGLLPQGVIGGTNHDQVVKIDGLMNSNTLVGMRFVVPSMCAGRVVQLRAEYRTENIRGGVYPYHGIHFDYELRADGQTSYPPDWQTDPSPSWTSVTRTWAMPVNMRIAGVRVGLQGVAGTMYVRNLLVNC